MPRIHLLPDALVSQIAAGEVVERPASVVKELMENALDAGAREVVVELEAGGRRRIRVVDDGGGMGRDDALLAFDRHATSKIAAFDDLQRVATLGFRGEALAAIAAVARVELLTAEEPGRDGAGGTAVGWRVRIEGARVIGEEPAARARGTSVEVASLFFNVPARRKFLKSVETELRRAVEVVQGYALARPDVRFLLRHEGRLLLDAPAAAESGARERIRQLFGSAVADGLVEIEADRRGGERIAGFVGRPGQVRGRRLFVFLNGRLLRDRALLAAFYGAVREEWKIEEAPSLFLFLDIPPAEVDVNVHPQKAEVRFRDPALVERVREALRDALRRARGEAPAPLAAVSSLQARPGWEGLGSWTPVAPPDPLLAAGPPAGVTAAGTIAEPVAAWASGKIAEVRYAAPAPVPLSGRGAGPGSLRLLGQYKGALLLLESPEGLLLLDQHAAHERILFERLSRVLAAGEPAVQRLLAPRLLELAPAEGLRLAALRDALAPLGFLLEPLSGRDLALVAVPATMGADEAESLLTTLAGEEETPRGTGALRERLLGGLAASRACRAAIKIHRPLAAAEMEQLVSQLLACDDPYSCPHGRPTFLRMSDAELERRFARR